MFNKRTSYDIEVPAVVSNVKVRKLKLPYQKVENSKEKILIVFDSVHRTDYRQEVLASGMIGEFLKIVDQRSKKTCGASMFASSICTLNLQYAYVDRSDSADTEDEDDDSGNNADVEAIVDELNRKRLLKFIKEVKPTRIVTMGKKSFIALRSFIDEPYMQQVEWSSLLGVPVAATISGQKVQIVPMLNPSGICVYTTSREPYLIGYFIRCWTNAVLGKIRFDAGVRADGVKTILVDTIEKFDKMFALIMRAPKVAIDTETDNLNRVANRLLMIQFAVDAKKGFVLPFLHYDTPFTKKELTYIRAKMREFFLENNNDLHIYCNANFDIPVIRHAFEFPFYKNEVWDIQAGEYALDENIVELVNVTSVGYYSLGNLSIQYGFDGYASGKFGKEDRVGISKLPLSTPGMLNYAAFDVVVPFAIQKRQVERAELVEKHEKYQRVVRNLIGDTIHTFSTMNVNGILADQKHLWWLSSASSPIIEEVKIMESRLLDTDEVRQAERMISKANNVPTNTLFGNVVQRSSFSLRKKAHLKTLFFDVMKLEPINIGKDGPSLDKEFQEEYQDNPIVSSYTSLNKAKKIRDAFVKSLIKIVSKNEDAKLTGRIRSAYKYLQVVTGRTSSSDPNLQQIPSHGKLAAYIKRVFVAAPRTIFIKVDYSAHEVRGLALVGNDKVLAGSFQRGLDLYDAYLKNPTPLNLKKFAEEGDIHIINASFFFGMKASEVTKLIRQSVKAVVFGLIYGRSAPSIAAALGRPVEEVEEVMKKFFARFKAGAAWLKDTVKFARANAYVEAPTGLRRHLWPYLLPVSKDTQRQYEPIAAACDRRANNSPIQGMGSGIGYSAARHLETWTFKRFKKWSLKNNKLPIRNQNMVHDSMEHEVQYTHIGYALEMIQESLTKGVQGKCIEKFGMKFPVDLSIEMDIGATLDTVEKWDGSIQSLHDLLKSTFEFQRDTLKYKVDVDQELENVFTGYLPPFLIEQAKNGYFKEAKKYGMKVNKELFKTNQAELARQYKDLAEAKAKKAAEDAMKKAAESSKEAPKAEAKAKSKDKPKTKLKSKAKA